MAKLTHLDEGGHVRMVDVSGKSATRRVAVAEGVIRMRSETLAAIRAGEVEKGEALAVARIAAIEGAKRTATLIPLCHPIPVDAVEIDLEAVERPARIRIRATVTAEWRTGVEMEALCAVTAGLLALYDMCKAMDRGMELGPIRLLEKRGGRSGTWRAPDPKDGRASFEDGVER